MCDVKKKLCATVNITHTEKKMVTTEKVAVTPEQLIAIANAEMTSAKKKLSGASVVGIRKGVGTFVIELQIGQELIFDAIGCETYAQSLYDHYLVKLP